MTDKDKGVSATHVNKEQLSMFLLYYGVHPWTYVHTPPYDLLKALGSDQGEEVQVSYDDPLDFGKVID